MTPGEWFLDRGVPLVVNSLLIPGAIWFVGVLRKSLKEFQDVGDGVRANTLEVATMKAELQSLKTQLSHVTINVRDLGRYLGGDRAQPFKGFRPNDEES